MSLIVHSSREMQRCADAERASGKTLALVPTMGALHEGHLHLVAEAKKRADHVTVSVFVNPTQFGPNEDFDKYPRDLEGDVRKLQEEGGVEVVFAPSAAEVYPGGLPAHTFVEVEGLDQHLCGAHRPGHFRGVTTVVAKLFLLCKPHLAFFGLKDAQQFLILRRMVRDLPLGVEVIGVPTVREADGLAMSSRNVYLTPEARQQAVVLSQAVAVARARIEAGERHSEAVVEAMRNELGQAPDAVVQYAEVVAAESVQPVAQLVPGQEVLAAVAVFFGTTRLIDNAFVRVPA